MAKAGFCSECGSNVWLDESGRCPAGHGAECIQNVYEAEVPPLATPQAAASVASESREPTAAASGRGKKTAVILAITTLVVVGLAFGGFRVYDALLGEEPILEVAADYDAAVFENDWDRLKGFTRFSDWEREDFETRMPPQRRGSEINRVVEDDRLILELLYGEGGLEGAIERRYYEPIEDDVFLESFRDDESFVGDAVRDYYEERDPDSHLVRVLVELELPDEEPRVALGSYMEVYKEGDKWDVRPRGLFFTDEEKERFYGKPVPD